MFKAQKPVITPGLEPACGNTFNWRKALCGHAVTFDMADICTRVLLNDGLCRTVVTTNGGFKIIVNAFILTRQYIFWNA